MHKVKDLPTTVLVRGESGTGKELVAKALHFESTRQQHPFVPVNCAAIPENLVESTLFGHKKGSFTGADRDSKGACESAGDGTLFLDEIGELPLESQGAFLRMLQEKEFIPVGEVKPRPLRARLICATNVNLEESVSQGEFREDLYHRLNVFPLSIPPLSARPEDLEPISSHLLDKLEHAHCFLSDKALAALKAHNWPGNVRELENCLERACILSGGNTLEADNISLGFQLGAGSAPTGAGLIPEEGVSLEAIEKSYLEAALEKARGNKTQAAGLLGISRRAIYSKMKTHGLA
jgi:transcriptional regulator with PAS, ATPase and Fis domain